MKIAVTGGSGKAGRAVVGHLLEQGHDVLNVDRVPSAQSSGPDSPAPFIYADLTDCGETVDALGNAEKLHGIEAVVHLAAIPSPVHATPDLTFRTNVTSTHTVFSAAARLGFKRIVWASSETTLGLPFDQPPDYAPVDEEHELRHDYDNFPGYWDDPQLRKWNLWGYVDESHVAHSVSRALEANVAGADSFIIAAGDIDKARRVLGYAPEFTWRELF